MQLPQEHLLEVSIIKAITRSSCFIPLLDFTKKTVLTGDLIAFDNISIGVRQTGWKRSVIDK